MDDQAEDQRFGQKQRRDFLFGRADGFQDADLFAALDHQRAEIAGDAKRGDGQDQRGQQKERGANLEDHVGFGFGDRVQQRAHRRGQSFGESGADGVDALASART